MIECADCGVLMERSESLERTLFLIDKEFGRRGRKEWDWIRKFLFFCPACGEGGSKEWNAFLASIRKNHECEDTQKLREQNEFLKHSLQNARGQVLILTSRISELESEIERCNKELTLQDLLAEDLL